MGGLCQVPKIMYIISYAFNITLLIVIIIKDYLSGFISISGVRYTNFSYHDIGAILSRYDIYHDIHLWFEITMKHYYEVNK